MGTIKNPLDSYFIKTIHAMKKLLTAVSFLCCAFVATAKVKLPQILSDGMVLQRNDSIRIWGTADPKEEIHLRFLKKNHATQADTDGRWEIMLPPRKAGGPYTMEINGTAIHNIYIGDVWLTSGQSNMDLPISRVEDLYKTETDAYRNAAIHLIQVSTRSIVAGPQDDIAGSDRWEELTPDKTGHWSAVSYFFAKEMFEATGVPQGIINSSQGGSAIEGWMSRKAIGSVFPKYLEEADFYLTDGYMQRCKELNAAIGKCYNALQDQQDPGLKEQWMNPEYDDSGWETVNQYDRNLGAIHGRPWRGTLWFRKTFDVPAEMTGQEGMLRLGCLIDADEAYINGQKVGVTYYQYPPRKYRFGAGLLKAGKNVLCIRLKTGAAPEKFVREKPYKIIVGNREISLEGNYLMRRGVMMPAQPGAGSFDNVATGYYNGMIAPIARYRIGGIVWYQGETNAGRAQEYQPLLEALTADWRSHYGDVPMIIVQLANFMQRHSHPVESGWAALREAQRKASLTIPNAGLATAADLGEWNDIHPLNKKALAHRVALQAQRLYLKNRKTVAEGPAYESCRFAEGKAILSFRAGTDEFAPTPADSLTGFSIAGADGRFVWAKARIEGKNVIVWNERISDPKIVRYGWDDNPKLTLYGATGLPAAPFSTQK